MAEVADEGAIRPPAPASDEPREPRRLRDAGAVRWRSLGGAWAGWLFDGYESYALFLTLVAALPQLLPPAEHGRTPFYSGLTVALTLFGFGLGGIAGGVVADRLGRRRMLLISMVLYAVLTGLSALAWDWASFAVLRLLTGVALGSEWGTGTALVAETWPAALRARAAALVQSGLGVGFFVASLLWWFVAPLGPESWRLMFLAGVLPALVALWVRRGVPESAAWERSRGTGGVTATTRRILRDPGLRRITAIASLMSLATTLAWWGVSTWIPAYVETVSRAAGWPAHRGASVAGMVYTAAGIAGYIALGTLADRLGRRWTVAGYFALSLALTPVLFLGTDHLPWILLAVAVNGLVTLGQYSWMPVWLPELYPTAVRATGISLVFNLARFVACAGPLLAGWIITVSGGFGVAATAIGSVYLVGVVAVWALPETRGRPLPA